VTPAYAAITPTMRHTAAELSKWLAETPGFKPGMKMSKEDMIVQLNLARQAWRDKAYEDANASPSSRPGRAATVAAPKANRCSISAAEINAWLAGLPPVPLANEGTQP
jgi:hypothetical protein